ncbi:MAG: HAD family hydrolase [archaeon]
MGYTEKAVFLDRDGVINEGGAVRRADQLRILKGVPGAIRRLNQSGYKVVVATNQPDIAKGFCTFDDVDRVNDAMKQEVAAGGGRIDAVYLCPHHPERGHRGEIEALKVDCGCRKPRPGMLVKAMEDLNIDPASSWLVGDSDSDIEAGKRAGLRTIRITSGPGSGSAHEAGCAGVKPDHLSENLGGAVRIITR